MSASNPVGAKHSVIFATPVLSAFPGLTSADTAANGRVAEYQGISPQAIFGTKVFTFRNMFNTPGPGTNPAAPKSVTLSIEVCTDGTAANWVATTAALNHTAVTQVVLAPGAFYAFDVLIGKNTPFFRITAIGGGQIEMTMDNDSGWQRVRPVGLI